MRTAAMIARIAMWIMIGAIVLSFFKRGPLITTTWIIAAVICGICILIVAVSKPTGRRRRY